MLDLRPVLIVVGVLMAGFGASMLAPALVDFALGHSTWPAFLAASGVSVSIGLSLWASARGPQNAIGARAAIIMTVATWLSLAVLGALPFLWSGVTPTFADAFFESVSGITTTGATVITGLDTLPAGILFWRAILQWLGGLGIVVMAVAVLPMLRIGGMQLFKAEAFETPEKILPRATQISGTMTLIYVIFTTACAISYVTAGMALPDAVMHAMTTVATGGFSTKDGSIGHFGSAQIELVAILFMLLGSLPFFLYIQAVRGRFSPLWQDSQVRWFLALVVFLVMVIWLYQQAVGVEPALSSLRQSAFNTVSIITGTGYASTDYEAWGSFATGFFFVIMFIGGCAGSTSCGIKIFRFQVMGQELRQQAQRLAYPNAIFIPRFNGRPISNDVSSAVMSFFFLYVASFYALAYALTLTGLDTLTAFSGAGTAISNVGPGLGDIIGPAGTFQDLNAQAKWLLAFGMILGRLELFTIMVLILPSFWRT